MVHLNSNFSSGYSLISNIRVHAYYYNNKKKNIKKILMHTITNN